MGMFRGDHLDTAYQVQGRGASCVSLLVPYVPPVRSTKGCPTWRSALSNALKAAFTGLSENGWMMWMKNDDEIVVDELGCIYIIIYI